MKAKRKQRLPAAARRALLAMASAEPHGRDDTQCVGQAFLAAKSEGIDALLAADLVIRQADGTLRLTDAGRAHAVRVMAQRSSPYLDPFLAQHLQPEYRAVRRPEGVVQVLVDEAESPLTWLARRRGGVGGSLVTPDQLEAGERLRAEFTYAQLTPRITANWCAAVSNGRRGAGGSAAAVSDSVLAARERVRRTLDAVGPEFSGLLLDVCCFLKGLEDVERERKWPIRSAKVVLQLGLDRLARHYGIVSEARGPARAAIRTWLAPSAGTAPS